jgi:peptidyl-tRNA hydrolase
VTPAENVKRNQKPFSNVTGACCALTQGDYTHHHTQVAIIHQELAIKCGLLKGKSIPYYKYEPQAVLEDS